MKCISPTVISDPRNNGGTLLVPCGHCAWCKKRKQDEWFIRFKDESHHLPNVRFLTLTNDSAHLKSNYLNTDTGELFFNLPDLPIGLDAHLIKSPTNDYRDLQLYFKRVRKAYLKPLKYFAVGEYGSDGSRPHFHALVFGSDCFGSILVDKWYNGFATDVPAGDGSFRYVTKYLLKGSNVPPLSSKNKILCSKNPAIGFDSFEDYFHYMNNNDTHVMKGNKDSYIPIPRLYKRYRQQLLDLLYGDGVEHCDIVKSEIESSLDYLDSDPFFSSMKKKYFSDHHGSMDGFDNFIKSLYLRDCNRQTSINKKDGQRI